MKQILSMQQGKHNKRTVGLLDRLIHSGTEYMQHLAVLRGTSPSTGGSFFQM